MGIVLHPGTAANAAACGNICYEAFKAICTTHNFPPDFPTPEVARGLLSMLLAHREFYSVVAESEGRIVSCNFLDERSSIAGVRPITVDPTGQNRGAGGRLMQDVLDRAAKQKAVGVRLFQSGYHNRSLCLYTKLGFRTREPISVLQGTPLRQRFAGYEVRLVTTADVAACTQICNQVHGFDRAGELRDATYPRDGFFYGHVSWHLSLCELQAGDGAEALRLFRDALTLDRHSGGPQQKVSDGVAFLWRSELAGHSRDTAAWRNLYEYAKSALPGPGSGLADLHVILAQAVVGDDAALDARTHQMEMLAREGRYPSGPYLPALARGFTAFERGDFAGAIEALAPVAGRNESIGGSRAQHDLIEFTLLSACLKANRPEQARRLVDARRPGASGIPVMGLAAVH